MEFTKDAVHGGLCRMGIATSDMAEVTALFVADQVAFCNSRSDDTAPLLRAQQTGVFDLG
jgi:hypothetical protein